MKSKITIVLSILLLTSFTTANLQWEMESIKLDWETEKCLTYKITNPTSQEILTELNIEGSIQPYVLTEQILLPPEEITATKICLHGFPEIEKKYVGLVSLPEESGLDGEAPLIVEIYEPKATKFVGVGLAWNLESIHMAQDEEKCVQYGIYNPFDIDVQAKIQLSESLKTITTSITPEETWVTAKTFKEESIPVIVCFLNPKAEQINGTVSVGYKGEEVDGTGSLVGASVEANLNVITDRLENTGIPMEGIAVLLVFLLAIFGGTFYIVKGRYGKKKVKEQQPS